MSRGEARRTLNYATYQKQMEDAGIFSTSICHETIDEAPDTYKKASVIQEAIGDTATIIHKLKPVYNLKSSEDSSFRKKKKFIANGNTPDDIWSRVKETLPRGTVNGENESAIRAEFEKSSKTFCAKYRR